MPDANTEPAIDFDSSFKVFYELMAKKVSEILLVSSPYDAFIMEEDGRLAERIIREYRGLNLSRPPRVTWVSSAAEALETLSAKKFDFVITMPSLDDMDPYLLGREIKRQFHNLPVFLLAHNSWAAMNATLQTRERAIDKVFVWSGNTDLLLAIVKSVEDRMNVAFDTRCARVRVIILVEDSAYYCSSILPFLYKEIVMQTQAVLEESLNEEHRLLRMRARPKILLAETFEEALELYHQNKPYLLSLLSDVRFQKNDRMNDQAGFDLLSIIKQEAPDIPLLILSSEEANREKAHEIPASFLNKTSASLHTDIRAFFTEYLGFGDFVFRLPDGGEVTRVSNLRAMEKILPEIPDQSVFYHATRNDFSTWLMARSEVLLASKLRPVKATDFPTARELKEHLLACVRERRKGRQLGIVTDFVGGEFDPITDFAKIGKGSLGGKARGLAFVSTRLKAHPEIQQKFPGVTIFVPKTLVVSTEGFDALITENGLKDISVRDLPDDRISEAFLCARCPDWLQRDLEFFLKQVKYPLAVRSSSLLEDSLFQPFAGIYNTYMIPNNHPGLDVRLGQLLTAIKLVWASTYYEASVTFARSTLHRTEEEKMAVIIQQLAGTPYGDFFYPTFSGVAQSYNFYPMGHQKPEEGIVHVALGLGKTVVEGEKSLRFAPPYPQFLPQFSTVEDILQNSQRFFYALKLNDVPERLGLGRATTLAKLEIDDCTDHLPVRLLASTYMPQDHRIRDTLEAPGFPVLTFAQILKYKAFPLSEILQEILAMGRRGMGCPVEVEFAVNLPSGDASTPEFALLQIRPMAQIHQNLQVEITDRDIAGAFCFSSQAMGHGFVQDIADIVFVKPATFDPAFTVDIAAEIARVNKTLVRQKRKYLLIGAGRWGSADRWLGIPVKWNDISGIGAIIEYTAQNLNADPSQGSHFFSNITSLGISYITVDRRGKDFIDWQWLESLPAVHETRFLKQVSLTAPLTLKIDGKKSMAVILRTEGEPG